MPKNSLSNSLSVRDIEENAAEAASFLSLLTNKHRLLLLCILIEGERSVSDLVEQLSISQSATSQHLALLKEKGLVTARRDAQRVLYSISDPTVASILEILANRFCP